MEIKNKEVRSIFMIALFVAFLIYLAGMTYILIDTQLRLGCVEHYIAHHVYSKSYESCGKIDEEWQQYER